MAETGFFATAPVVLRLIARAALACVGLGALCAFAADAQATGSIVRRVDGEVIQKLPCRVSKYSDKPVCPATVLSVPPANAAASASPTPSPSPKPVPSVASVAPASPASSRAVASLPRNRVAPRPALETPAPASPSEGTGVALAPELLAIADLVERGSVACEFGLVVTVSDLPRQPGHFVISSRQFRFRMVPVLSSTGAIRLEDPVAGAVWLQLPEKSMLMSQRKGIRLADACVTPIQAQTAFANAVRPKPGLLDVQGSDQPPSRRAD